MRTIIFPQFLGSSQTSSFQLVPKLCNNVVNMETTKSDGNGPDVSIVQANESSGRTDSSVSSEATPPRSGTSKRAATVSVVGRVV